MKRGTRAWHDPRTGLHGGTGEDTLVVCSPSTNCLKRYCLIKQSPKTVRPGGSTISQERTSHRLSGPPQQDLQCCTPWQREGRRSGLTATSTWGSPQGNGNQNEDVRRIPQRVRQVLSHVRIITTCTLPVIWYPGGAARWQREELDATELQPQSKTKQGASTSTSGWKWSRHNAAKILQGWRLFIYSVIKDEDVWD